jgi:TolA-binding protein
MTQDKIDLVEKRIASLQSYMDRLKWQMSSLSDQLSDLRGDLSELQLSELHRQRESEKNEKKED